MQITISRPKPGQELEVRVQLDRGRNAVEVIIGGQSVATRNFDCPDPPCYQSFKVAIPSHVGGRTLEIRGTGAGGLVTERATIPIS